MPVEPARASAPNDFFVYSPVLLTDTAIMLEVWGWLWEWSEFFTVWGWTDVAEKRPALATEEELAPVTFPLVISLPNSLALSCILAKFICCADWGGA